MGHLLASGVPCSCGTAIIVPAHVRLRVTKDLHDRFAIDERQPRIPCVRFASRKNLPHAPVYRILRGGRERIDEVGHMRLMFEHDQRDDVAVEREISFRLLVNA